MSSAEVVDHSAAVAAGQAALRAGRWAAAKAEFERALTDRESADALGGLADALWWLCEAKPSVRCRERAFVLLSKSGDVVVAGRQAINLAISYLVNLGNEAAAHGWLARAERVTGTRTPNPLQGWLYLVQAFLSRPPDARDLLHKALEFARTSGDSDLELVALADLGLSLVVADEVDDGLTLLDEAMAATLAGEYQRLDTVVYASCDMLAGCSLAGDLDRAAQWCRVADEFMRQYGCPFLYARCRVHYGNVLVEKGQWDRADEQLRAALGMAEDAGPGPRAEAAARLAELRVRQGRLDEAAALLAEFDDAGRVPVPAAAVRLAQGQAGTAAAMLARHRAHLGDRHVELAPTLALLVDAYLAMGDQDAAEDAAEQLATVADQSGRPHALAVAALAEARVRAASGRLTEAAERTDVALRWFDRLNLPLDAARARLDLARLAGPNSEIAIIEGRRALSAFEQLGARRDADRAAALLRKLGATGRVGPKHGGALTRREQEVLRLVGRGLTNPEIAARLYISRKTAAHHVSHILAKLGLRNRAEAVAYALRELGP